MRYLIVFIFFTCFCIACDSSGTFSSDWEKMRLKGEVKHCQETFYYAKKQGGDLWKNTKKRAFFPKTTIEFTPKGYIAKTQRFDTDGKPSYLGIHQQHGDTVRIDEVQYYEGQKIQETLLKQYPKNSKSTLYQRLEKEGKEKVILFQYETWEIDENEIGEIVYEGQKIVDTIRKKSVLNKQGNEIEEIIQHSNGLSDEVYRMVYLKYDAQGNWIQKVIWSKDEEFKPLWVERELNYF